MKTILFLFIFFVEVGDFHILVPLSAFASQKTLNGTKEVFVGDLPEGVYFYEVSSANTKYYGKFIIRR